MIAAYHAKDASAAPFTIRKGLTPGRARSAAGSASAASAATSGRMPTPIANAPSAHAPYSRMRPFQKPVTICHSADA